MEIGVCKQCGQRKYIQNKTRYLCADCVYKNNHGGKSRQQVAYEKQQLRKNKRQKATGEKELFLQIWKQKPHYCMNCGKYLGDVPRVGYFSHRQSKGVSEANRLNPDNIDLLCFDCHFARDMQGKSVYDKRKGIYKKL